MKIGYLIYNIQERLNIVKAFYGHWGRGIDRILNCRGRINPRFRGHGILLALSVRGCRWASNLGW